MCEVPDKEHPASAAHAVKPMVKLYSSTVDWNSCSMDTLHAGVLLAAVPSSRLPHHPPREDCQQPRKGCCCCQGSVEQVQLLGCVEQQRQLTPGKQHHTCSNSAAAAAAAPRAMLRELPGSDDD